MMKAEGKSEKEDRREAGDPVLSMLGVGKQLWERETGDSFVERLRREDPLDPPTFGQHETSARSLQDAVWNRIESHQGQVFRTATGLPFTYLVEGAGLWFSRDGRRINRKLTRTQVEVGISRCPLTSTTEIKDLMDYAYLYALLMDPRIRNQAW